MSGGAGSAVILSPLSVFSPRDPGGTDSSTGLQVLMGQEPVGLPPDGGSDIGLPMFLEQSSGGGQPATPVRLHRSQSVDTNPLVAYLVGEPPPPPKTPPPTRRRSKSTPRISNRGSSYSFDDSTVVTAESQRSVRTQQQRPVEERLRVARTMLLARGLYDDGMLQVIDPPSGSESSDDPMTQVSTPRASNENSKPTQRMMFDQDKRRSDLGAQHAPITAASSLSITTSLSAAVLNQQPFATSFSASSSSSLRDNGDIQMFAAESSSKNKHPSRPRLMEERFARLPHSQQDYDELQPSASSETSDTLATNRTAQNRRRQTHTKVNNTVTMGRSFEEAAKVQKEEKRGFFGKIFGRNKKNKKNGEKAIQATDIPPTNEMAGTSSRSATTMTTTTAVPDISVSSNYQVGQDSASQQQRDFATAHRRVFSPADYYQHIPRNDSDRPGSIFFAHDEVSAMTIPTFDTNARLKDPEEDRSGQSSEPMGTYWNIVGRVDTMDDIGNLDSFREPDGASPQMKQRAKGILPLLEVPVHDPSGESPLNAQNFRSVSPATAQAHVQDPSPRGFQSPSFSQQVFNDPVGESPLHKHVRGPSAFLDGSPYAQDPPLYLYDVDKDLPTTSDNENETETITKTNTSSASARSLVRMDSASSFTSIPPPPPLPPSPPLLRSTRDYGTDVLLKMDPPPPPPMPPPRYSSSSSSKRRNSHSSMLRLSGQVPSRQISIGNEGEVGRMFSINVMSNSTENSSNQLDNRRSVTEIQEHTPEAGKEDATKEDSVPLKTVAETSTKENQNENGNPATSPRATIVYEDSAASVAPCAFDSAHYDDDRLLLPTSVGDATMHSPDALQSKARAIPCFSPTAKAMTTVAAEVPPAVCEDINQKSLPIVLNDCEQPDISVQGERIISDVPVEPAKNVASSLAQVVVEAKQSLDIVKNDAQCGAEQISASSQTRKDNVTAPTLTTNANDCLRDQPSERTKRSSKTYESSDDDSEAMTPRTSRKDFFLARRIGKSRITLGDTETAITGRHPALYQHPDKLRESSDDESIGRQTPTWTSSIRYRSKRLDNKSMNSKDLSISITSANTISPQGRTPATSHLTMSAAAKMNAKAVAYLHSLDGEPSPRHNWRRANIEDTTPSSTPNGTKKDSVAFSSLATGETEVQVVDLPVIRDEAAQMFLAYSEKFKGRKPAKASSSKCIRLDLPQTPKYAVPTLTAIKSRELPIWKQREANGRDISISAVAVHFGYNMRRLTRRENIANGLSKAIVLQPKPKVPEAQSYFGPYTEPEPKDPILRAGRRLLSKSAVPVQAAARRYLAQKEAVDRMWALLEVQSYMRRWRAEANFLALRLSSTMVQKVFRGFLVRSTLACQRTAATEVQRIFRGYCAALHVYEDVYRIILVQAMMRGKQTRDHLSFRTYCATRLQAVARGISKRQSIIRQIKSALTLQATWRMYQIRQCFQFLVVDVIICQSVVRRWLAGRYALVIMSTKLEAAATRLQIAWRRHSVTQKLQRNHAATKIQSVVRTAPLRRAYLRLRATMKIQRAWRQWFSLRVKRRMSAAMRIQAVIRRWPVRRELKKYRAATRIQSIIRRYIAYEAFNTYLAASRIQALVRGCILRIKAMRTMSAVMIQAQVRRQIAFNGYERYRAATTIQAVWRGFQAYTDFIFTLVDVIIVQRTIRGRLGRLTANRVRKVRAIRKIQSLWRCWSARCRFIIQLSHIIQLQTVARVSIAKAKARLLRQRQAEEHARKDKAASRIQATWRGFWLYSHYLIMRYEAVRLQAIVRGRAAVTTYNLTLGCCIMIQANIRRYLGAKRKTNKLLELAMVNSSITRLRETIAARRLQVWWRIVIACRKEKEAALVIERFFVMVKDEVDREIQRAHARQKLKKHKRKKRREDGNELDEVWLQMLDDNESQADVFSVNDLSSIGVSSGCRHLGNSMRPISPRKKATVRHAASSPSMKLVMRHDLDSPKSSSITNHSPVSRKSLARQFKSLLDDDKSVERTPKSLLDDEDSTVGPASPRKARTSRSSSAEKFRQMYGIKSEPNRVSRKSHFFGESPPISSKQGSYKSNSHSSPSAKSNYKMVPSRSTPSLVSGSKSAHAGTGASPRHGKILVMQSYSNAMDKAKSQSWVDGEEDLTGREEFGLI